MTYRLVDPASIECGHGSVSCARIVVLDKSVIETLALKLCLIGQLAGELVLIVKRGYAEEGLDGRRLQSA